MTTVTTTLTPGGRFRVYFLGDVPTSVPAWVTFWGTPGGLWYYQPVGWATTALYCVRGYDTQAAALAAATAEEQEAA